MALREAYVRSTRDHILMASEPIARNPHSTFESHEELQKPLSITIKSESLGLGP